MNYLMAVLVVLGASAAMAQTASSPAAPLPPDEAYTRVDAQGHLTVDGQRIRFWGAIGSFPGKQLTIDGDPYFQQRDAVRRAKVVGFNMYRIWHLTFDDNAVKGDLSQTDVSDFFMAECGRQGVRIWAAGFGGGAVYEDQVEKSAGVIDDPATADAWIAAVKSMCREAWWTNKKKATSLLTPAVAWDERLEALAIQQMKQKANHVNMYTGLRHADDPTIAVWELTNEQWWMPNMLNGQWQKLPAYFRARLIAKWNAYLLKKYGSQEGLVKAWGFVFPGEDVAKGTVLLAPLASAQQAASLNDTNPAALEVFKTIEQPIGRAQCVDQRGADVIDFLLQTIIAHKQRFAAQLKTWGKSCRLSPLLFDTGIGQSIQAQYMQMHADAVSHASYMEGIRLGGENAVDPKDERWPFYSGLDSLPQMCNDVPWLEHNRPIGKPFLCYETQYGSPSKYRAEWPLRLSALASIQDWDAACYHYWTFNNYKPQAKDRYAGLPLAQPGEGAFQYDYTSDELEQAAMRAGGAIFRNLEAAPAEKPTVFYWGRRYLYDPRSMEYGGDYGHTGLMDMMHTTYHNGMRLVIDPDLDKRAADALAAYDDANKGKKDAEKSPWSGPFASRQACADFVRSGHVAEGPVAAHDQYNKANPLQPSPNVTYDWRRGHLIVDSPGAASYTGFLGQYGAGAVKFGNGVELRDVVHVDPPGTGFPAGSEKFTSFTLASEDGRPLDRCAKAVLVLVASSFNTGLAFTQKPGGGYQSNWGKAPVLVTRVGATVAGAQLAGMKWRMIDFNENVLDQGTVGADGLLKVPADKPVWLIELTR